ncbi:hypothetical protein FKR81_34960 [Lentzea tibetensis]|uniref:Methylamine utilisation protein MauE domain-containing protein n=1 Tax=Lentzea tibetensis TaxID=2591470 RepID=A0A563EIY6_9PSEU|nr:MauE/DoxX family redox-associated membrane protein [Lentzea tibetensis]TWP46787.1 hypothetical protein FKR81_34960 [Lentzea tibetensis]
MTGAVVSGLVRGLKISCGCFGTLGELIRNAVLLAAVTAVALHGFSRIGVSGFSPAIQLAAVAAAATVFGAVFPEFGAAKAQAGVIDCVKCVRIFTECELKCAQNPADIETCTQNCATALEDCRQNCNN